MYVGQRPIFHGPLILPYIIVRLKLFLYIKKWHRGLWDGGAGIYALALVDSLFRDFKQNNCMYCIAEFTSIFDEFNKAEITDFYRMQIAVKKNWGKMGGSVRFLETRLFSSPEPGSQGELIGWDSSRHPSVRASVRACVHTFKHEYLRDQ